MRILELSLAGVLALAAPIAAPSAPLGLNLGQAMLGPVPGVIQAGDGRGSNWPQRLVVDGKPRFRESAVLMAGRVPTGG